MKDIYIYMHGGKQGLQAMLDASNQGRAPKKGGAPEKLASPKREASPCGAAPKKARAAIGSKTSRLQFPINKPPPMGKIGEPRAPFELGQCVVYTACKAETWRVNPDPKNYKNEKVFPWGDNPKAAWANVIAYCKNPVVPNSWARRV